MLKCTSAKGNYRVNVSRKTGPKRTDREIKPESEWGSAPCEPIVSEEVFDRVQRIFEEQNKPAKKPGKKPVHIFAGLLRCGCGHKMYVYTRSPNYTCNKCKNKIGIASIEESSLEPSQTPSPMGAESPPTSTGRRTKSPSAKFRPRPFASKSPR